MHNLPFYLFRKVLLFSDEKIEVTAIYLISPPFKYVYRCVLAGYDWY
jgi:hypothetical protein